VHVGYPRRLSSEGRSPTARELVAVAAMAALAVRWARGGQSQGRRRWLWGGEVELRVGLSCGASRDNDTGREGGEVVGALPCRDDA
jgi:hypothetical protein